MAFGKPELVTGDIRTITGRYGENCDETGTALLKFPGGIAGTLSGGWVDVMNPVTCEISGTEGFAYVRNGELFVKSSKLDGADGGRSCRPSCRTPSRFSSTLSKERASRW